MSRTERLLDLLQMLRQRRTPVTGPDLARELGISIRTLYRDIATLQAQGADIKGEPGLGYVLKPGFMLPPLMFSNDEIEALILGSRWVAARTGDERLGKAASNALSKIAAVLPPELRERAEATTFLVAPGNAAEVEVDPALIRTAIRAEHKLAITYRKEDGSESTRIIWPILIGFFERVRIVVGWCELREDYRHFRIDRIVKAEEIATRYPRRRVAMAREWRASQNIPSS
jgi:predicted DNA-binding transcriptional regulator YafY